MIASTHYLAVVAVRQVGVAVADVVAPVADEQVGAGPEHRPALRVVRHGEQPFPDVELDRRLGGVVEGEEERLVGRHVLALALRPRPRDVRKAAANTPWPNITLYKYKKKPNTACPKIRFT